MAKSKGAYQFSALDRGVNTAVMGILDFVGLGETWANLMEAGDKAMGYETRDESYKRRLLSLADQLETRLKKARSDYDQTISALNQKFSDKQIEEALAWAESVKYQVNTSLASRDEVREARKRADQKAEEARSVQREKDQTKSQLADTYSATTNQIYNDYSTEMSRASQYANTRYGTGDTGLLHSITTSFKEE